MKGKTNACLLILCALCTTFLFACGGAKMPDASPKQEDGVHTEEVENDGDSEGNESGENAEENTPPVDENSGAESGDPVDGGESSEENGDIEEGSSGINGEMGEDTGNGSGTDDDYSVGGVDIFKPKQ